MIDSVRDRATFRRLRTQGTRGRSGPIRAIYLPHDGPNVEVAFAIGRKFGSAVHRNRARRRIQAALRDETVLVAPGAYLFSCHPEVMTMPFASLLTDVQRCVDLCQTRSLPKADRA